MIDIPQFQTHYINFKKSILKTLMHQDPLTLLQNRIFEQFQQQVFGKVFNQNQNNIKLFLSTNQHYAHQSIIKKVHIPHQSLNYEYKIIERRSHSQGRVEKTQNKIKRMEELHHIDLMIYSNILANIKLRLTEQIPSKFHKLFTVDTNPISKGQNPELGAQNLKILNINLQKYKNLLLFNPTPAQIEQVFRQISDYLQEQNEKIKEQMNKMSKDLQTAKKKQMQLGQKELRVLLREKQIQKKNQESIKKIQKQMQLIKTKKQEISERSIELDRLLGKRVRAFQEQKIKTIKGIKDKYVLQELWMKVQLDSIRRNTLYQLDKEGLNHKIRQQQLLFKQPHENSIPSENSSKNVAPESQQTS